MNWILLAIILTGGTVVAGGFAFMMSYMIQMRQFERISYREIHQYIAENREAIRRLEKRQQLSEGDEPGD